jgi:serine protease Do
MEESLYNAQQEEEKKPIVSNRKSSGSCRKPMFGCIARTIFSLIAGAIGGGAVMIFGPSVVPDIFGIDEASQDSSSPTQLVSEDDATIVVVERVSPSVASIVVSKDIVQTRRFFNSPFDFFFDTPTEQEGETEKQRVGGGTGFFVSEDGMMVTNKHVVEDEDAEYTVVTRDGMEYPANVLARDPLRDVAILKVEGSGFPVVELGESESIRAGQTVIAIGYSLGEFANSVSKGIVSGIGRSILAGSGFGRTERLDDIIQTDAAINPGNSGGPLLDINGRVIGVNVAVAQGAENIGFALPIDPIKTIINQVRETGEIASPFLGVRYVVLNETIVKANNLDVEYGALVIRGETISDLAVIPGSPADRAGIRENDIILEIDGKKITEEKPLETILADYSAGDTVVLTIWSAGETREERVVLEKRK